MKCCSFSFYIHTKDLSQNKNKKHTLSHLLFLPVAHITQVFGLISPFDIRYQSFLEAKKKEPLSCFQETHSTWLSSFPMNIKTEALTQVTDLFEGRLWVVGEARGSHSKTKDTQSTQFQCLWTTVRLWADVGRVTCPGPPSLYVPHLGVVVGQLWSVSLTCVLRLTKQRHTQEGWERLIPWCGRTQEGQGVVLKGRPHYLGFKTVNFKEST